MQLISLYFDLNQDHDVSDSDVALHINDIFGPADLDHIRTAVRQNFRCIVSDHYTRIDDDLGTEVFCFPIWLEHTMSMWQQDEFDATVPVTNHCFNFTANKKALNRYLMIKFVEMFGLTDYSYTWSGIGRQFDLGTVIQQLDSMPTPLLTEHQRSELLAPIKIPEHYLRTPASDNTPRELSSISVSSYREGWDSGLRGMFETSAISLISESNTALDRVSIFTEKTLHSVFGLTFPIWVGHWGQAQEWERLGYDSFSDVIDHSYQHCDTLIERCYRAIELNLHLLQDRDLAHGLRIKHLDRLLQNRNRVLSDHIYRHNNQLVQSAPQHLQPVLEKLAYLFRRPKPHQINK